MLSDDLGYSETSLQWTYLHGSNRRETTATFMAEYASFGERTRELLNAAKRKYIHNRPHTITNAISGIRKCVEAVEKHCPESHDIRDWNNAVIRLLQDDQGVTEGTKFTYFTSINGVLQEVARARDITLANRNPFQRHSYSDKPLVHGDGLAPLVDCARRDAFEITRRYRSPDPQHLTWIEDAKRLAAGDLLVSHDQKDQVGTLARHWRKTTGLSWSDLTMYLYPSPQHLMPFLLLLSLALVSNPDSLSLLRRDAVVSMTHPSKGPCMELTLEKPRSGQVPQFYISDQGTLSEGQLLRTVLDMTKRLTSLAHERDQNFVFLCATNHANVTALTGQVRAISMVEYIRRNNLPKTTVKALRSARLTDEMIRTRDPFRVWQLSGNASFDVAAGYVIRRETEDADDYAIATAQMQLLNRNTIDSPEHIEGEEVALQTHTCKNAYDQSKPHDENGLCSHLLWPYNDADFSLTFEPRAIAFLLRDYQALCEAQKCLPPERFARRYAHLKRLIEADYLPMIDEDLFRSASAIVPSLPALDYTVATL